MYFHFCQKKCEHLSKEKIYLFYLQLESFFWRPVQVSGSVGESYYEVKFSLRCVYRQPAPCLRDAFQKLNVEIKNICKRNCIHVKNKCKRMSYKWILSATFISCIFRRVLGTLFLGIAVSVAPFHLAGIMWSLLLTHSTLMDLHWSKSVLAQKVVFR